MKKLICLFVILAFIGSQNVFAQSRQVSGVVTSANDGLSIPGVSVMVKGTTVGTTTDLNGRYSLNIPENGKNLIFSFVGMAVQEVIINSSTIDVILQSESIGVDEVLIIGYSTTTKKSFTGTAQQINSDKLAAKSTANISQALAGEVAGVRVINTSGQPGTTATIRIRGIGSVNGNRSPLYIVDGVPYDGDLNSINPSDIASTTILKDASATAIYGSRGANGVIVLTTKKGKTEISRIEVESKFGVNMKLLPEYDVISSPELYTELTWEGLKNKGSILGETDPAGYANTNLFQQGVGISPFYNMWNADGDQLINATTGQFNSGITRKYSPEDWEDHMFDNSTRKEINVKLSGGSDQTTYYTSFGFLDDKGYYINSDFKRYTGRVNVTHKVKPWLKGSMNIAYSYSEKNSAGQTSDSNSGFWFVANIPPIYPVYLRDIDGHLVPDTILGGNQYDFGGGVGTGTRGFGSLANPVSVTQLDINQYTNHEISGNSMLEAKFLRHFKLTSRLGLVYRTSDRDNLRNPYYGGSAEQNGSIYKVKTNIFSYTWLNMLRYQNSFGLHNLDAFVAHENSSHEYKYLSAFKSNLADPTSVELNNAVVSSPSSSYINDYAIESFFGQVKYDYDEKYFIHLVARRDGSSRFKNEKWGTFGSIGAAWMMSKENFMSSVSWVKDLKLKASYGWIGEQDGVGFYPGEDLYNVNNLNDQLSFSFNTKGNPDLTWEKTIQMQFGTEFSIGEVLEASFDYYIKKTDDLIFNRRVSPSLGYAIITVNDGKMENSGFEFDVIAHVVNTNDFQLDLSLNGAMTKNEIKRMPIEPSTGKPKVLDQNGIYGRSAGHSIFDIYVREYAGVDVETGQSSWYRYFNETGNGSIEYINSMADYLAAHKGDIGTIGKETTTVYADATEKYINKSPFPDVQGAFRLEAKYKGFELSTQFIYSLGGDSYDYVYAGLMSNTEPGGNNWHKDILNRWQSASDVTDVPRLSAGEDSRVNSTSSRFITSNDYLALNNIRLNYNLPKRWTNNIGLEKVNVWVSGDNLWVKSARKGFDPSSSETGSSSTYRYSPLSTITTGLRIQF